MMLNASIVQAFRQRSYTYIYIYIHKYYIYKTLRIYQYDSIYVPRYIGKWAQDAQANVRCRAHASVILGRFSIMSGLLDPAEVFWRLTSEY